MVRRGCAITSIDGQLLTAMIAAAVAGARRIVTSDVRRQGFG
jgi:hypothetical protein